MPDVRERSALSRIREYLDAGYTIDEVKEAGWGDWIDYFESRGVDLTSASWRSPSPAGLMILASLREVGSAALAKLRWPPWTYVSAASFLLAAAFAYKAVVFFDRFPPTQGVPAARFDPAMPWLGAALLALLIGAWRPSFSMRPPRAWGSAMAGFWREHWVEVVIFAAILAFAVFMRLYRFGDTLPPADGLCCEEKINGGAAYAALEGKRPILFPLVRWGSAFGFFAFGETTFGLRFFFVVLAIFGLIPFYLLLRQIVSVPSALFGAALYAAAWWPSLRARQASDVTIYAVLFVFFFVTGIRKRSPVMLLAAGIVAGLIEYEYEAYRIIPLAALGFVGAAAVREVVLRRPLAMAAMMERARSLVVAAWRPALVFSMAAGIVLVPLAVGTWHSNDLFFTSLRRQEHMRASSRFVDNWPEQVKWTAQIFSPVGPREFPTAGPRDPKRRGLLDPIASTLAVAGLAAGIVLSFRGFRLLFAAWIVSTAVVGSLLLSQYAAWKFIGLVPIFLILGTMLVDDVRSFLVRALGSRGSAAAGVMLVVAAAASFWWNADTLFNNVDEGIRPSYGRVASLLYSHCDYLRGRGEDNFTFSFENTGSIRGFVAPHDTPQEQGRAWGDLIWACHDLKGQALVAPEEAWPLRHIPSGPVTLELAGTFRSEDAIIDELNRAYPGLGRPDHREGGPVDSYSVIGYEFASGAELARFGLWGDYSTPSGDPLASRVDRVSELAWDDQSLPRSGPFTVRWRGVVYAEEPGPASLQVVADDPALVLLDGEAVHDTRGEEAASLFPSLLPGWHVVEITLDKATDGGSVALVWVTPGGRRTAVEAFDLFPLAETAGWRHERSFGSADDPRLVTTQRFDFEPHFASARALKRQIQADGRGPFVTGERWSGVWEVDESGSYLLDLDFRSGTVTVLVDGEPLLATSDRRAAEVEVDLERGTHALELVQEIDRDGAWSGLTLAVHREVEVPATGGRAVQEPVRLRVTPY